MTAFEVAVARQQWQLVAVYLLLGISQAASKLPPESLTALIDLVGGESVDEQVAHRGEVRGG